MDWLGILAKLVLALHLLGLVMSLGSGMASSLVGPLFGTSDASQKNVLFKLLGALRRNGHVGLGILWVTGILLVFMRGWDITAMPVWFWIKMFFVIVLSAAIGMSASASRKFEAGDMAASTRVAMAGAVAAISGVATIVAAVFAFQ